MNEKHPKATHQGTLEIAGMKIPCAVLEDGTRVLRERSIATTLGRKGSGTHWQRKKSDKKGALLPEYVSARYLMPFISDKLHDKLIKPITYRQQSGTLASGMSAVLLPEICEIWLKAKEKGAIPNSQARAARNAEILMRGFARIGIIALVDEATGYQDIRDRKALQKIIEMYIAKELKPWVKTFPDEFYEEMFRLRGWQYKPLNVKKPQVVGRITNDIIYSRLAPGVLSELQKQTPKNIKGRRKHQFHRLLTDDIGSPKLREHISNVLVLMKAATNWSTFRRMIQRALPERGATLQIPFDIEDAD